MSEIKPQYRIRQLHPEKIKQLSNESLYFSIRGGPRRDGSHKLPLSLYLSLSTTDMAGGKELPFSG